MPSSAADTLEQAKALGANVVMPPMVMENVGTFAYVADPTGAVFALYASAKDVSDWAPPAAATPGMFSWHELASADPDAAWNFYSTLFGWEKTETMDMGDEGTYQMYGKDGETWGGIMRKPQDVPMSSWLYYVTVEDIDSAVARVTSHAGQVVNGPMEVPGGGRIAHCQDPQGAWFALHQSA